MQSSQTASRKRFYKEVSVGEGQDGFGIKLDGRPIRTPAGNLLSLPTRELAEAVAAEWAGQGGHIIVEDLPLTRLANSAIDGVAGREAEIADEIMRFAASDLICYRASSPAELAAKQAAAWDPILSWSKERLRAPLSLADGVHYVEQPPESLAKLREAVAPLGLFQLAALHVMTALTGSALLSLAHISGLLNLSEAWAAAHIDEDWQMSQWGEDYESSQRRKRRLKDMEAASRFFQLASSP